MSKAEALREARELMGELWADSAFEARNSIKLGWLIHIDGKR